MAGRYSYGRRDSGSIGVGEPGAGSARMPAGAVRIRTRRGNGTERRGRPLPVDVQSGTLGSAPDVDSASGYTFSMTPRTQVEDPILSGSAQAAQIAVRYLLDAQYEQGYWWADLTADTTLESDWILLQLWLHAPVNGVWNPPGRPLIDKAVRSILDRQLEDGGFNIYPQGPSEISACLKAYFALKLPGGAERVSPRPFAGALAGPTRRTLALRGNRPP